MPLKPTPFNRYVLLVGGSVMLLFAARQLTAPRARYVAANPEPGAALPSPPPAVKVTFSRALGDESAIDVIQTVILSPSGEKSYPERRKLTTASGVDPGDTERKTLRADLESGLLPGLYFVDWRVYAARGNALRFGSFYFGVGMPVPAQNAYDKPGKLSERDYHQRGRRSALAGGIALILLAVVIPWIPRKG